MSDRVHISRLVKPAGVVLALLGCATVVRAAPPQAEPVDVAEPVDPGPTIAGFWLSLELIGPRGAQIDAAEALRTAPVVDALPRGGTPPPGELVGRVDTLEQALAFVERHAFDGGALGSSDPSAPAPAPLPGGALLRTYGVHLTALVLTGASASGGTQPFAWPPASALPVPATWSPASLAVARAPVFAAPSPSLPPASERYRVATLDDAIWQLGAIDRCTATGDCLRWAQILVRQGDRWFGGWIPAAHVVADRDWVGGPNERRFALIASHRDRAELDYVLVEQADDRHAPPRGLSHAYVGATWPSAGVQVLGDQLVALVDGQTIFTVELLAKPAVLLQQP